MNIGKSHVSLFATLFLFTAGVYAQPTPPQRVQAPINESQLSVQSIVPNSAGITVSLTADHVEQIGCGLEKQNLGTGNWVSVINSVWFSLPSELAGTLSPTSGKVTLPIIVQADPSVLYRLSFWTKSTKSTDDGMDWYNSVPMTFKGYESTVSQTFKLEFTSDALKISAKTSDVATLTAAWQFPGETPVSAQESIEKQSPDVSLSFAALQAKPSSVPSLVLTLVDKATNQKQEARLTLTVASTPDVSKKVNQISAASNPSKQNLSWGDIAKTGISALLKFFAK